MHTTISQIITLLHVSTLSCHPQAACNQYLAKLHQYFVLWTNKCTQQFQKLSHCYMFRHYRVILRQPVTNTLPSYTSILCYEPHVQLLLVIFCAQKFQIFTLFAQSEVIAECIYIYIYIYICFSEFRILGGTLGNDSLCFVYDQEIHVWAFKGLKHVAIILPNITVILTKNVHVFVYIAWTESWWKIL